MFENDFPALLHSGPAPGKYYRPFYGFSSMVEYQTLNHEVCGLKSLSCLCNSFSTINQSINQSMLFIPEYSIHIQIMLSHSYAIKKDKQTSMHVHIYSIRLQCWRNGEMYI